MPCKLNCDDNSGANNNPVQELGQRQLADLQTGLKQVKQLRKEIQKKRKDVQNQAIELERKQAISCAKYGNIISQKEQATKEMQELRMQIACRQRKIEELEKRQETVQKNKEKVAAFYASKHNSVQVAEDELKARIAEVRDDLEDVLRYNSTQTQDRSAMVEELEEEGGKRLNAKVTLETLKDRQNFVRDTKDKELAEQLRLDQQLQKLKTLAAERDQERSHIKQIIDREQGNLQKIITENVKLTDTANELTESYNTQRGIISKLIRELKCTKHDEGNLAEMVRDGDTRVANQKSQLDKELQKHNCLFKSIQEKEALQGEEIIFSSCQSSISEACAALSSPTLSTTYLDSRDGYKKASSSSCNGVLNSIESLTDRSSVADNNKIKKMATSPINQNSSTDTSGEEEGFSDSDNSERESVNATFGGSPVSSETAPSC